MNEFFGTVFIEAVASGGQALDAIASRCPELVLATHPMPSMNGIALARLIKARPNPPAVVVSIPERRGSSFTEDLRIHAAHDKRQDQGIPGSASRELALGERLTLIDGQDPALD